MPASDDPFASSGRTADIPPLLPAEESARLLEGWIVEAHAEDRYRVRVRRVTTPADLHLIGREVTLQLRPETIIYWIGNAEIAEGTTLLVSLDSEVAVDAGNILEPSEVDVQNGTGEMF